MLETTCLLVQPWVAAPSGGSAEGRPSRLILDAASGKQLGLARLGWRRSLAWFVHPQVTVAESPDESLLFTLHRTLLPPRAWYVHDADGGWVGTVYRRHIRFHSGRPLARIEPLAGSGGETYRNPEGRELAVLRIIGPNRQLTFADWLGGNPFLRMLLLAAALRDGPIS
jgi:hypothetical protein